MAVSGAAVFGSESELRELVLKIEAGPRHSLAPEEMTAAERESAGWLACEGKVRKVRGRYVVTNRGLWWLGTFEVCAA